MFLIKSIVKYYKLIFYNTFMLYPQAIEQNLDNQRKIEPSVYNWTKIKVKESVHNIFPINNKKDQIIYRLTQIWINISSEDFDFDTKLTEDELKKKHSPDESYIHIAPMLSTKAMFDMIWLDKDSLKDKNITDIWWWFTALPFELQEIVASLEIVDPCFASDIEKLIDTDIGVLEKSILINKDYLEEKEKIIKKLFQELDNYIDDNNSKWHSIYLDIERQIIEIKKNIKKFTDSLSSKLQVVDELKMWKELIKKRKSQSNNLGFQNIRFNSSVWENIKWINDDSQDIVFINHLLTKSNISPYLILSEAARITKKGWEIIVVNDIPIWLNSINNSGIIINQDTVKHKIWFKIIKK